MLGKPLRKKIKYENHSNSINRGNKKKARQHQKENPIPNGLQMKME